MPNGSELTLREDKTEADPPESKKNKGGRPRVSPVRIEDLKSRLLQGVSDFFLRKYAVATWDVSHSQARRYIQHAKKLIRHEAKPYTDDVFLDHLAIRRDLRKRANEQGDLKLVLEIAKDEASLLALYDVKKKPVEEQSASRPHVVVEILNSPLAAPLLNPTDPPAES